MRKTKNIIIPRIIGGADVIFDAELNTDCCNQHNNAELTITLRIGFHPVDPVVEGRKFDPQLVGHQLDPQIVREGHPLFGQATWTYNDDDRVEHPAVYWRDPYWTKWTKYFVSSAQKFWDGKFWLMNDSHSFAFNDRGRIFFPNVWCRLKLEGSEILAPNSTTNNHVVVNVVRLAPSWTKFFQSHWKLYCNRDIGIEVTDDFKTHGPIRFCTHYHEVGHLLGLRHVRENDFGQNQYGRTDFEKVSVMGKGMALRPSQSFPWAWALREFVNEEPPPPLSDDWTMRLDDRYVGPWEQGMEVWSSNKDPGCTFLRLRDVLWKAQLQRRFPRSAAQIRRGVIY